MRSAMLSPVTGGRSTVVFVLNPVIVTTESS